MEMITKDNFQEKVHQSEKPVIVDFYGEMCQPCKQMEPIIDKIEEQLKDKFQFYRIEIIGNQELFVEHGVASVPTLMIFKDGQPVADLRGLQAEEDVMKWITDNS